MGEDPKESLEGLPHERAVWKMQRWGWAVLVVILLAALGGLLGHGPLSRAVAGQRESALWVEYARVARYQAPVEVRVHLGNGANPAIWFARHYIERLHLDRVYPPPERVQTAGNRLIYIFNVGQTNQPTMIAFHFKPAQSGKLSVDMGLVGGPELRFSQLILP